jgi:hypothetical protein
LPDAFTDYKGLTKSWYPAVNAPERVEVLKKTTQAPSIVKWGRATQSKKDNAPNKHPRKEKTRPLQKIVNVTDLWLIDTLWTFHNLALKHAIETRMLAHRKTLMISYWGNH